MFFQLAHGRRTFFAYGNDLGVAICGHTHHVYFLCWLRLRRGPFLHDSIMATQITSTFRYGLGMVGWKLFGIDRGMDFLVGGQRLFA